MPSVCTQLARDIKIRTGVMATLVVAVTTKDSITLDTDPKRTAATNADTIIKVMMGPRPTQVGPVEMKERARRDLDLILTIRLNLVVKIVILTLSLNLEIIVVYIVLKRK